MRWLRSAYSFGMPRPPKVVPITRVVPVTEHKPKLIAQDEQTKRFIIAIGQQRIAFDHTTRITHLPPNTGDQPAPVRPLQARRTDLRNHSSGILKRNRPKKSGKRRSERKKPTRP